MTISRRLVRNLLIALGAVVGLLAAVAVAVVVVLKTTDFNKYKGAIEQEVKQITGRDLNIAGQFEVIVGLNPSLAVDNVSFSNAAWGTKPDMVVAKRFEIQIELLPLLHGAIRSSPTPRSCSRPTRKAAATGSSRL